MGREGKGRWRTEERKIKIRSTILHFFSPKESYSLEQFDVRAGVNAAASSEVWRLFPQDATAEGWCLAPASASGLLRGESQRTMLLNPPCHRAPLVSSFQTSTAFTMSDCNSLGLSLYLIKRKKKSKGLLSFVFPLATEFPPWQPGILAALITMEIACP